MAPTLSGPTEFVEPVQLQVVCRRLWANLPPRQRTIRQKDVEKFADVHLALTEFYEEAVAATVRKMRSSETPISELRLRTWFDKQLITPNRRTRSLVYRDADTTGGLPNAVVDFLDSKARLVRPMIRGRDTWYELVHDRLVVPISRSNEAWRSIHAPNWQLLAERWRQENQTPTLLLGEEALAEADQWIAEQQYILEPHEERFLDKSRKALEQTHKQVAQQEKRRTNLAETGWGLIFAQNDPHVEEIKGALHELLELRQQQAGARYQVLAGDKGYQPGTTHKPGESGQQFLTRFGVGPGVTDYDRLPYYLLIVGDPERIPFEFQYALQTQYAVGRLYFQTPAEYSRYARSVVQSENGSFSLPPTIALFGPQDPADSATTQALDRLFSPLLDTLLDRQRDRDWKIDDVLESDATKTRLLNLLGGPETPALLFSGSYGASTPAHDPEQQEIQGAIMCQVTPTPRSGVKPESPQDYLAAGDIGEEARLLGSIAFLFGGWSAGTPHLDSFPSNRGGQKELAPSPFIARLPQRLLGHAKGGMLAVIGHVDQAWTTSFSWRGVELAINHFSGTLRRLMEGYTVGAAAEPITQRYHQLSSMLAEELQQVFFYDGKRDDPELAQLNLYTVDTRNFIILGDPAVRLPLENGPVALERPTIEPVDTQEAFSPLEAIPEVSIPEKPIIKGLVSSGVEATVGAALLYFNGIDGTTGQYWTPPMTAEELAQLISQERSPENLAELRLKARQVRETNY
jgi:hypothetical protein